MVCGKTGDWWLQFDALHSTFAGILLPSQYRWRWSRNCESAKSKVGVRLPSSAHIPDMERINNQVSSGERATRTEI
ncbi:unnamed protein product [Toxocara canis]|uniref:Transposase n=1 Tax=Toxocara canis TaxID=6265 RepID=A0A183U6P1_TOXCA|nr:unnamed protein product [Toxocara canis]